MSRKFINPPKTLSGFNFIYNFIYLPKYLLPLRKPRQ